MGQVLNLARMQLATDVEQSPDRPGWRYRDGELIASINSRFIVSMCYTNLTRFTVELFWINFKGEEISYGTILPGTTYLLYTYLSHPWVFRNQNNHEQVMLVNGKMVTWPSQHQTWADIVEPTQLPWNPTTHKSDFRRRAPAFARDAQNVLLAYYADLKLHGSNPRCDEKCDNSSGCASCGGPAGVGAGAGAGRAHPAKLAAGAGRDSGSRTGYNSNSSRSVGAYRRPAGGAEAPVCCCGVRGLLRWRGSGQASVQSNWAARLGATAAKYYIAYRAAYSNRPDPALLAPARRQSRAAVATAAAHRRPPDSMSESDAGHRAPPRGGVLAQLPFDLVLEIIRHMAPPLLEIPPLDREDVQLLPRGIEPKTGPLALLAAQMLGPVAPPTPAVDPAAWFAVAGNLGQNAGAVAAQGGGAAAGAAGDLAGLGPLGLAAVAPVFPPHAMVGPGGEGDAVMGLGVGNAAQLAAAIPAAAAAAVAVAAAGQQDALAAQAVPAQVAELLRHMQALALANAAFTRVDAMLQQHQEEAPRLQALIYAQALQRQQQQQQQAGQQQNGEQQGQPQQNREHQEEPPPQQHHQLQQAAQQQLDGEQVADVAGVGGVEGADVAAINGLVEVQSGGADDGEGLLGPGGEAAAGGAWVFGLAPGGSSGGAAAWAPGAAGVDAEWGPGPGGSAWNIENAVAAAAAAAAGDEGVEPLEQFFSAPEEMAAAAEEDAAEGVWA